MTDNSPHAGGAGVIEFLMRTRLHRQLTLAQAESLWRECKTHLQGRDLQETVDECDTCRSGRLDTLPRGDVLDALSEVLAGVHWPLNMASETESDAFIEKMKTMLKTRGYARCGDVSA